MVAGGYEKQGADDRLSPRTRESVEGSRRQLVETPKVDAQGQELLLLSLRPLSPSESASLPFQYTDGYQDSQY